ncbi:MAG: hypothetical protein NTZ56_23685 [Acidobacteria bacterium]|nr:hypothetical protein [Acidobacteriota bacterium]
MRQPAEFFGDQEMDLVYIARKLREAKQIEELLDAAGVEYAVEVDKYLGGVLFKRELDGAFFYVLPDALSPAQAALTAAGLKPAEPMS